VHRGIDKYDSLNNITTETHTILSVILHGMNNFPVYDNCDLMCLRCEIIVDPGMSMYLTNVQFIDTVIFIIVNNVHIFQMQL
jgi:hypothetical protein